MARPRKKIDVDTLIKLAAIQCTLDEMAQILGVDKSTLSRRYATEIDKGREHGKMSLRRKMFDVATNGNVAMLIWLSKQYLGHADKLDTKNDHTTAGKEMPVVIVGLPAKGSDPDANGN